MKKLFLAAATLLAVLPGSAAFAQTGHYFKRVYHVAHRGVEQCSYFRLNGVSVADPAIGGEWFAIPGTHPRYNEVIATLITAQALRLDVHVVTTGGASCGGYATVRDFEVNNL